MRRALFALLSIASPALLSGCEADDSILLTHIAWMDWPADVAAGAPFTVRLVVYWPCAASGFRPGPAVDQSAVTFAPYFLDLNEQIKCADVDPAATLIAGSVETTGPVRGLAAEYPRTYEMRATTLAGPVRTFGDITVRLPGSALRARRNAAGRVLAMQDSLGCTRIRPAGLPSAHADIVVENPDTTSTLSGAFVRGYLHEPGAPVCGATRVFHLVTVN